MTSYFRRLAVRSAGAPGGPQIRSARVPVFPPAVGQTGDERSTAAEGSGATSAYSGEEVAVPSGSMPEPALADSKDVRRGDAQEAAGPEADLPTGPTLSDDATVASPSPSLPDLRPRGDHSETPLGEPRSGPAGGEPGTSVVPGAEQTPEAIAPGDIPQPQRKARRIVEVRPDPAPPLRPPWFSLVAAPRPVEQPAEPAPVDVHISTIEIVAESSTPATPPPPPARPIGFDDYARLRAYEWDE